jgi:arginase
MKPLIIIESPSNLGLKESAQGKEPGVNKLPQHLKKHGLYDKLNPAQIIHLAAPPYSSQLDEASGVLNAYKIVEYAKAQAQELKRVLATDSFPVVIGGDCSILIGNALALKELVIMV